MGLIGRTQGWLVAVIALTIVGAACSGSSSPAAEPIAGNSATTSESGSSGDDVTSEPTRTPNAGEDIPGYDPRICVTNKTCPEEIESDVWTGLAPGTIKLGSAGGSTVTAVGFRHLRQWDIDDVLNGDTVIVTNPLGDQFGQRADFFSDGRVAVRFFGNGATADNAPIGVFDLRSENPGVPVAVVEGESRDFVVLSDGRLAVSNDTGILVYDLADPTSPVANLDLVSQGFISGPNRMAKSTTGGVYFENSKTLYEWVPGSDLAVVADLSGLVGRYLKPSLLDNGMLAIPTSEGFIGLFDFAAGTSVVLDSLPGAFGGERDPIREPFQAPDGRIIAQSDTGFVYSWDLERPNEPTVLHESGLDIEDRNQGDIGGVLVLDDGRLVTASNHTFGPDNAERQEIRVHAGS